MNCRFGSIAGPVLAIPLPLNVFDQTWLPLCASNATILPRSPCRNTRSLTPPAVLTSVSSTGAPSGTSLSDTENRCFKRVTVARVTAVSLVLFADFPSSKANCNQSVLAAATGTAVATDEPTSASRPTTATAAIPLRAKDFRMPYPTHREPATLVQTLSHRGRRFVSSQHLSRWAARPATRTESSSCRAPPDPRGKSTSPD